MFSVVLYLYLTIAGPGQSVILSARYALVTQGHILISCGMSPFHYVTTPSNMSPATRLFIFPPQTQFIFCVHVMGRAPGTRLSWMMTATYMSSTLGNWLTSRPIRAVRSLESCDSLIFSCRQTSSLGSLFI